MPLYAACSAALHTADLKLNRHAARVSESLVPWRDRKKSSCTMQPQSRTDLATYMHGHADRHRCKPATPLPPLRSAAARCSALLSTTGTKYPWYCHGSSTHEAADYASPSNLAEDLEKRTNPSHCGMKRVVSAEWSASAGWTPMRRGNGHLATRMSYKMRGMRGSRPTCPLPRPPLRRMSLSKSLTATGQQTSEVVQSLCPTPWIG